MNSLLYISVPSFNIIRPSGIHPEILGIISYLLYILIDLLEKRIKEQKTN